MLDGSTAELQIRLLNDAVRRNFDSMNENFRAMVDRESQLLAVMKCLSESQNKVKLGRGQPLTKV